MGKTHNSVYKVDLITSYLSENVKRTIYDSGAAGELLIANDGTRALLMVGLSEGRRKDG